MFRRKPPAERPAAVHQRAGRSFEVASDRTRAGFRIGTGPVELAAPVAPAAAEPDGPQQPEREFVPGIAARMPRKRVSAGALFRDAEGRILVVEPTYKPQWEIPGGVVEAGEEPWAACRREVAEELGLDLPVGGLLAVDWAPGDAVWGDSLNFVFDGGVLSSEALRDVRLPADELSGWRFEPPAVVASRVRPEMARRLAAAVAATGPTYLVSGRPLRPE